MLVITYPAINPYIIRFGELGVTWYSLSYVVGIIFGWQYCNYLIKKTNSPITLAQMDNFITWEIIGIIIGGRLGHVILYEPDYFLTPLKILETYKGGMSFHGGIMGLTVAGLIFCRKYKISRIILADLLSVVAPFGIMLGRIANFINGELYGKVTELPWGVIFPGAGDLPRHPTQIYEALSEGLLLQILMSIFAHKEKYYSKRGFLLGLFLCSYAMTRSFCEIFKVPDYEVMGITAGQLYSIPMLILGIYFINRSRK